MKKKLLTSVLTLGLLTISMASCSLLAKTNSNSGSNNQSGEQGNSGQQGNSGESGNQGNTENQGNEQGNQQSGNTYSYDQLETITIEGIYREIEDERFNELTALDVYFEHKTTHERVNDISFSYDATSLFGPYEMRAVIKLKGTWYRMNVFDDESFEFEKNFSSKLNEYSLRQGILGDYVFTINCPLFNFATNLTKTSFDFACHINWNDFTVIANDITYSDNLSFSYTGAPKNTVYTVRYYVAKMDSGEVSEEYVESRYLGNIDVGQYDAYATMTINADTVITSKHATFSVGGLSYPAGSHLSATEIEYNYQGTKLSDYEIYCALLDNNDRNIKGITYQWVEPNKEINPTTAVDGYIAFDTKIKMTKTNYVTLEETVHLTISFNNIPAPYADNYSNDYTGNEHTASLAGFDENIMEIIEENSTFKATHTGTYIIQVKIKDGISATFDGGEKVAYVVWRINKALPYDFYWLADNSGATYRLDMEDEEGNIYPCQDVDGTFQIPYEAVTKKGYLRLYRIREDLERYVEIDAISFKDKEQGSITGYGYDENKGIYISTNDSNFAFTAALTIGASENNNFKSPRNIDFSGFVKLSYYKELQFTKISNGLPNFHVNTYAGYRDNATKPMIQAEAFDTYVSVSTAGFTIVSIGCWFTKINEISMHIERSKIDTTAYNGRVIVYLGNNSEAEASYARGWMVYGDSNGEIGRFNISDDSDTIIKIDDPEKLGIKDGMFYVKFRFEGNGASGTNPYFDIKSLTIKCEGDVRLFA